MNIVDFMFCYDFVGHFKVEPLTFNFIMCIKKKLQQNSSLIILNPVV